MKDNTGSTPSVQSMENFLASSVHDMKNSVSMLICGLEKALAAADSTKLSTYAELVQMNHEAKHINSNLIQLLTLYKLGQKIYPFDPQSIGLDDFLQAVAAQYMELLKSHGINLQVHADPGLYWYFDEDLISGVIGNALNNAMRYTRDRINIIARENNGKLELRIEDNGEGYPVQILQESVDNMRSVDFQGGSTGLGFYFSAMVARMHHNRGRLGELKLENGGSLGG
ncbi:MAG: HAMP domain-containing sensor histidine kinase, partial [Pseudomonadota bacterium]